MREAANNPGVDFRLAGSGEEERPCRQIAERLGCNNVSFLGHLNASQLGNEMRQTDIFFLPSEIEGHPQVLGQAAVWGLPCVARDYFHPDYVVDGITAFLAGSDDGLSVALWRLIEEPDLRKGMSEAAVKHVAKFEWDVIAEQWQEIMESAIANRKKWAGLMKGLQVGDSLERVVAVTSRVEPLQDLFACPLERMPAIGVASVTS